MFPVMLRFQVPTTAKAFDARVLIEGRALGMLVDGEFWLDGVNPGGLTACGATLRDAAHAFREGVQRVIEDIAEDASSFIDFRQEVERFFNEVDGATYRAWEAARAAVKAGDVVVPGIEAEPSPPQPAVIVWEEPRATQKPASTALSVDAGEPALAA